MIFHRDMQQVNAFYFRLSGAWVYKSRTVLLKRFRFFFGSSYNYKRSSANCRAYLEETRSRRKTCVQAVLTPDQTFPCSRCDGPTVSNRWPYQSYQPSACLRWKRTQLTCMTSINLPLLTEVNANNIWVLQCI